MARGELAEVAPTTASPSEAPSRPPASVETVKNHYRVCRWNEFFIAQLFEAEKRARRRKAKVFTGEPKWKREIIAQRLLEFHYERIPNATVPGIAIICVRWL